MRTLLLVPLLLLPTVSFAQGFSDVPERHPYATAILDVQARGIVGGYPDGTFRPDATINRAEFTKIIAAVYGVDELNTCKKEWDLGKMFSDVRADDWFAPFVCVASKHDVVNGYPDGTFRGGDSVNFAEAAKMLTFRYNLYGEVTPVWYERGVRALARRGSIPVTVSGFGHFITRGEMAEMIYRLDYNLTSKSTLTYEDLAGATSGDTSHFSDLVLGVTFDYPSEWNAPVTTLVPANSDGGVPHQPSNWTIHIGNPCDGCAEGDDQHPFELSHYDVEDAATIEADIRSSQLIVVKDETTIEGANVIVFTEGGICGFLKAFIVGEVRAYVLTGNCADDSPESTKKFYQLLGSLRVNS